ncbi:hypothetical protein ACF08B_29630 [Streptomyces sp. NPDC015139]
MNRNREQDRRSPRVVLAAAALSGAVRALVAKLLDVVWPSC